MYLAAYGGAELMEYDPARPANFPENPRLVAKAPDAMRPVAAAAGDRILYYACSRPYGNLGSVLTRYDTVRGVSVHAEDPIGALQIQSLGYDAEAGALLVGSTIHADCRSCAPAKDRADLALIDATGLKVLKQVQGPEGCQTITVLGRLHPQNWLCSCTTPAGTRSFAVESAAPRIPPANQMAALPPCRGILFSGIDGYFILHIEDRFELWDMRKRAACVQLLHRNADAYRIHAQDASVYIADARKRQIVILEDCLKPYIP